MNEVYVFIDGVPNYDWYYNRNNTVYFTVVPTGDQLVEIAYPYAPLIIDPHRSCHLTKKDNRMDQDKYPHLKLIKTPPPEIDLHYYKDDHIQLRLGYAKE